MIFLYTSSLTNELFRRVLFSFQVFKYLLVIFLCWFLVWFHSGQWTYSVWFQFFKIYWGLFYVPGYSLSWQMFHMLFFLKDFIYLSLEREREGKREREKHQCVVASWASPTGDLACNPGMCPDWELNRQPFGSQASSQSTEPYQPGLFHRLLWSVLYM